jgi:hypothetical protein
VELSFFLGTVCLKSHLDNLEQEDLLKFSVRQSLLALALVQLLHWHYLHIFSYGIHYLTAVTLFMISTQMIVEFSAKTRKCVN